MDSATLEKLDGAVESISKSFSDLARQLTDLSSSLQRMASAGLMATSEGNKLAFVWTLFTRQIAGVVLPVVHFLIDKITQLTAWFRGLTGDAQFFILKLGLFAALFAVITPLFAALSAILQPWAIALGAIAVVLYNFLTTTATGQAILDELTAAVQWATENWTLLKNMVEIAVGGVVKAFQVVVAGFVWLGLKLVGIIEEIVSWIPGLGDTAEAIKKFRESGEKQLKLLTDDIATPIQVSGKGGGESSRPRQDVNPAGFGFESLSASFERITSAANKTDLAREALNVQKAQLVALKAIEQGVKTESGEAAHGGGADF